MQSASPSRRRSRSSFAPAFSLAAVSLMVLPAALDASVPLASAVETAADSAADVANTCSITYTAEEIPAIAANELWLAHYDDVPWRDAVKAYNAKKVELAGKLERDANTAELVGGLPLMEPGETATGSSVFRDIFDTTSSLTPERLGHVPYDALAFMYNADDWRTQVASAGCPAERPSPPKETRAVTVPEGSAVAPKEWQGALIGLLALLGLVAAGTAVAPLLALFQLPPLPPLFG